MTDKDDDSNPIVSGPPPRRGPSLADVRAALAGLFRSRGAARATATDPVGPSRRKPGADTQPAPTRAQVLSGAPAWVLAPAYLAFAVVFALPQAARLAEPESPRQFIAGVVAQLPGWAAPMEAVWNGWLWAPWWIVLPALLMRLNSVRITLRASLDAVGSSMAALVISGAAWLYHGRVVLGREGVPVAERDGAWQLLVAEFVFLFLIATWFSPNMRRRTQFEQG
jgi:hypothetical protein